MIIDSKNLTSKEAALRLVSECESEFNATMLRAADFIANTEGCRAVTLSGPTCSGKTTAASRLIDALKTFGKNAKIISIDDFYHSPEAMKRLGVDNFEVAAAIDTEMFRKTADDLADFRTAEIPKFDFKKKTRVSVESYTPNENDIFIFEGIQAIYPEILSCLESFRCVSVYICVSDSLTVDGVTFTPEEIRFMRRVVRDYYHRNSSVANTLNLWGDVRHNEEVNIYPYVGHEDVSINSLIPYEIFVVGREFLSLASCFPSDADGAAVIGSLCKRLSKIEVEWFDAEIIPESSLLTEFSK